MSSQGFQPGLEPASPSNGNGRNLQQLFSPQTRPRYWLHILLLLLTLLTATAIGARFVENFRDNRPAVEVRGDSFREELSEIGFGYIWERPSALATGLPFSLAMIAVLLAHEMGHYLACRYYRVQASLPYFMPAPTVIGTLGAFIRIRSPIYSRRVLFDIGIAGPLAGFVFLLPVLGIGMALSKVVPGIANRGDVIFGVPPLIWLLEKAIFPGVSAADIYLHPVARAAWVGILGTALNLLPIGQLDGGHIMYSFIGERHKTLSKVFAAALVPLAIWWPWWLFWAAVLLIFGLRHPPIFDTTRLSPGRRRLGYAALVIFALCFIAAPVVLP